jgi:RNA polymerase sigma-70 factor, ECF subfamily
MADPAALPLPVGGRPGDEAFGQRLVDMQPRVRAFLRSLGPGVTDDLVQETMTRAWRSRANFTEAKGDLDAWLMRIAFRAFLDERQRVQRAPSAPTPAAAAAAPADTAPQPAAHAAAREQLATLLEGLGATERAVLLQFHREGRSIAEIARQLSLSAGTVKSHLHRARARLWQRCRGDGA